MAQSPENDFKADKSRSFTLLNKLYLARKPVFCVMMRKQELDKKS